MTTHYRMLCYAGGVAAAALAPLIVPGLDGLGLVRAVLGAAAAGLTAVAYYDTNHADSKGPTP